MKVLSETNRNITFDERTTTVGEVIDRASEKWPGIGLDTVCVERPHFPENNFSLVISPRLKEAFRSDGQLTIYPFISLGQLERSLVGHGTLITRDTVKLCWNNGTLHLQHIQSTE
jgi:hypothetical protein